MLLKIALAIVLSAGITFAYAIEIGHQVSEVTATVEGSQSLSWIHERAPQMYVVQDGDTLWEIACKFLNDPGRWKQLWRSNPDIRDPDRIYPGDVISLVYENGEPCLRLERGYYNRHATATRDKRTGTIKLRPRVEVLPVDKPIPTIALSVIGPFFNHSRVITPCESGKCPQIVALDEDHIVVGERDRVYVSNLCPQDENKVFTVVRPGKDYLEPCCKEKRIGIEGMVVGKAKLEKLSEPSSMILSESYAEIKVGDRIIETLYEPVEPYFMPRSPNNQALGQIVSVFGGITQIGQYQVVVITGGCDLEREVGDVLTIFQTQKDMPPRLIDELNRKLCFPPLDIGQCVVFRVFDKVSYALVMKATRPIYLLDDVARS
ncbi:MAG TPA: LysM peptidoglycan-binding domain-containing protein [Candidatus Berkiella sp.]|nr:LysM peptidoglycan-binding domain-containing protein [Candidatus Berkiella sp.]